MPDKLYKSVDGILRIINTILITKGDNWASQVLDENRKPLLTPEEQAKFTNVLKPHIDSIINFVCIKLDPVPEIVSLSPQ